MRGMVNIEFILSSMVFLVSVAFVILTVARQFPTLEEHALTDDLRSKGYQLSELLMFGKGEPENWETLPPAQAKRFGLSSGQRYVLDRNKIAALAQRCADYASVRQVIGLEESFSITAVQNDGTTLLSCGPQGQSAVRQKIVTRRFGVVDGEIVTLTVETVA